MPANGRRDLIRRLKVETQIVCTTNTLIVHRVLQTVRTQNIIQACESGGRIVNDVFQVFIVASSNTVNINYINKSTYVTTQNYTLPNIFINEEELYQLIPMRLVFFLQSL